MPQALLLSGGIGVGKTTLGQAIGRLLTSRRHPTAVLDLDAVAQFGPAGPPGPADHRAANTSALVDCDVQVVRVVIPPDLIAERTRTTRGPEWDLQAALDQAATHQPIQDHT